MLLFIVCRKKVAEFEAELLKSGGRLIGQARLEMFIFKTSVETFFFLLFLEIDAN